MSHMLEDKIPIASYLLCPKIVNQAEEDLKEGRDKQECYVDRGFKECQALAAGDSVRSDGQRMGTCHCHREVCGSLLIYSHNGDGTQIPKKQLHHQQVAGACSDDW